MAVPLAVSCPRSGHVCHVIRSRYRISVTSPEGRLAWRPREGCGPHQGRIGRRSAIPSGAGGNGGTAARTLWRVTDPAHRQLPAPEAVDGAVGLLARAERPLIVLGKGAAYAQADEQIRAFVEATGIPYLPMSMAKGVLPDDHPQSVAAARSLALAKADVVMLVRRMFVRG